MEGDLIGVPSTDPSRHGAWQLHSSTYQIPLVEPQLARAPIKRPNANQHLPHISNDVKLGNEKGNLDAPLAAHYKPGRQHPATASTASQAPQTLSFAVDSLR